MRSGLCRAVVPSVRPGPTHTSSVRAKLSKSPGQQENPKPAWTLTQGLSGLGSGNNSPFPIQIQRVVGAASAGFNDTVDPTWEKTI